MPDGVRLSARIWMPPDNQTGPFPALFEYIPYRKRDLVRHRDERNHPFFAAHGYVCLRVDIRGSGDSEGVMPDMYSPGEMADARHVIEWIAAQPWCSGRVGMFGTSWGGTASLQAAVDAPEALCAVIANCSTADRFEDDIHWMGGCPLTDSIEWGATLPAILTAPPDPANVGDIWRDMWEDRLHNLTFPLEHWIKNATRGAYWRHGSVRFDTVRLSCPVLAIGGWSDRYSNSVMPLVNARPDLCWGIVGPWGHHYPDHGEPGPAIAFQELALGWWDHWLKGEADDVLNWPRLRLWQREFDPPKDRLGTRNGCWFAVNDAEEPTTATFHLGQGTLQPEPTHEVEALCVPFDLMHGTQAGDTGYFGRVGGLPLDQAPDDGRALCFDSEPLDRTFDLVGGAELHVRVRRDTREGQLVCRLCDVAPDDRSNLVTRTVLNLELDETLDERRTFIGGDLQDVIVKFPTSAYRFAAGHRIRLAIGSSYWPLVWPPKRVTDLDIVVENSRLVLPHEPPGTPVSSVVSTPITFDRENTLVRSSAEVRDGWLRSSWHQPATLTVLEELGLSFSVETSMTYDVSLDDPATATCTASCEIRLQRPDAHIAITSNVVVTDVGGTTAATGRISACLDDTPFYEKTFEISAS